MFNFKGSGSCFVNHINFSLFRRKDRPVKPFDRICSCHFKESVKTNGPSIFPWNQGQLFDFSSLPVRKHVT